MRAFRFALLAVVLPFSSCLYYPADPYYNGYPPPRPRHHHRYIPPVEEEQPMDSEAEAESGPIPGRRDRDRGRAFDEEAPAPAPKERERSPEPPKEVPDAGRKAPAPTPPEGHKDIPTASRSSKPGRVKNPFHPDQELDVSGLPSGSLAKDPESGRVFRVP